MNPWARRLGLVLRAIGAVCMLALVAVFMPRAWIDWCHQRLGLGPFPVAPVAEYLARSESFLYAALGAALWALGGAADRMGRAIRAVGLGMVVAGPIFLLIDFRSGLPWWWMAGEGPWITVMGLVILFLSAKARRGR